MALKRINKELTDLGRYVTHLPALVAGGEARCFACMATTACGALKQGRNAVTLREHDEKNILLT